MRGDFLPVIVQLLGICPANDGQRGLPAHRHPAHDFIKIATGVDVLWLQGTRAGFEAEWGHRRKANGSQQQQRRA